MGILRQTSLGMRRKEPMKGSIASKRRRAWMKTSYLEKVLEAGLTEVAKS